MYTRSAYTLDLQWNRVLSLEPSEPEARTLPPGHRDSSIVRRRLRKSSRMPKPKTEDLQLSFLPVALEDGIHSHPS
ncbi:hypothetical protein AVEN_41814-1 [Araneus ventricosus]|uniref:Uncharacterized protein n=1 Tax=Araneus ventricosus TaxID=182803 RepID=A0A4Y2AEN3_ARAVE|nr:hypothetical protein AVEN_41814-1 [Araneus ventricosus]